ncbi:hypothetical protein [Kitasatospora sp. NPDC093558]
MLCLAAAVAVLLVFAGHFGNEAATPSGSVAIWWPNSVAVETVG